MTVEYLFVDQSRMAMVTVGTGKLYFYHNNYLGTPVLMTDDTGTVELLQYLSHPREARDNPQICDIGCSHIAFTVADIDKEYARLLKSGVRFYCPPCISPDGYAKVAFCHDPDGTSIELVEVLK